MNKIKINTQAELEAYWSNERNCYYFESSVIFNCEIITNKSIKAGEYIEAGWSIKAGGFIEAGWSIKAGGSIKAGWYIEAGGSIKAGGFIKAGRFIKAGGSIEAGEYIEAGGSIKAGGSIEAGEYIEAGGSIKAGGSIEAEWFIFSFEFSISCKFFKTKRLPFWRPFWSEMPPFAKHKDLILDNLKCWNDYKFTKQEAVEICKWEGWHWILKGQLEMFFGLKEKCVPKEREPGVSPGA